MLRIVLVDDEQLIVNHLCKLLTTCKIPLEIVGTANNNTQALKVIKETHPNLVITDIRMGSSNGLDLCEKLKITLPYTKIIILSGHDDFDYARRALHYSVHSYLLKPIDETELAEQIRSVAEAIEAEAVTIDKSFRLKEQIHECLPMMKDWYFQMIHLHGTDNRKLAEIFELFQIDILGEYYQAIYINLKEHDEEPSLESGLGKIEALAKVFSLFIDSDIKSLYFYDTGSVTLLLSFSSGDYNTAYGRTTKIAEKVRQYIDFNYAQSFSIGLSIPTDHITNLEKSVRDAQLASSYSFYIGFGEIICISDVELRNAGESLPEFPRIQQDILDNLKMCDADNASQNLRIFYLNLLQLRADINHTKNRYIELYFYLSNSINQEFGFLKSESHVVYKQINASNNLEEIRDMIKAYVLNTIESIAQSRQDKSISVIANAKTYIKTHYQENISLETTAVAVGLSSCYLSTMFSSLEGISIKEYIIQIRIDAAKVLLKDMHLKIYEIAAAVGYMDSRYFSQLFRKKTGFTPGQYREFLSSQS